VKRVARGIVAIGDNAIGVLALGGGFARGVFAFGGMAVGLFAFGGIAVGLFTMGGVSLGLLIANGGIAIGTIAWGGAAAGYLAMGGGAFGFHHAGGNGSDAVGAAAFRYWAPLMQKVFWGSWFVFVPLFLVSIFGRMWAMRQPRGSASTAASQSSVAAPPSPADNPAPRSALRGVLSILFLLTLFIGVKIGGTLNFAGSGSERNHYVSLGAIEPWLSWKYISNSTRGDFSSRANFDLLSWSFLALVVASYLGSALWRMMREDKGKLARDPAWWRQLIRSMVIWCGLLFVAVSVRSVIHAIGG
jgi:hypothetical protein